MPTYSLTLRGNLGRKLSIQEMDNNWLYLQDLAQTGGTTSVTQYGFTASENIPSGVGVSLLPTGEVVRTKNEFESFTFSFSSSSTPYYKTCQIDTNKMVYLYSDSSNNLYARVIVNSGENISIGDEYLISSDLESELSVTFDICQIDSNKVFISYLSGTLNYLSNKVIKSLVGEISGTSISTGTEVDFIQSTNVFENTYISLCSFETDNVLISYRGQNSYGYLREATVSGTTITIEEENVFYSNGVLETESVSLDTNRVALIYRILSDGSSRCVIYDTSSNSLGSEFIFPESETSSSRNDVVVIDTDKILVSRLVPYSKIEHYILSISGLSISLNRTEQTNKDLNSLYSDGVSGIYSKSVKIDTNKIAFLYSEGIFLYPSKISVIDFSSGYQKYDDVIVSLDTYQMDICLVNTNRINFSFFGNGQIINIFSGEFVSNKFTNSNLNVNFTNYLGFSQNAANLGELVYVKFPGSVDENQSGLEIGKYYAIGTTGELVPGVQPGGGGSPSSTSESILVGKSISEDKLLLIESSL
jgi:hypothetical protein